MEGLRCAEGRAGGRRDRDELVAVGGRLGPVGDVTAPSGATATAMSLTLALEDRFATARAVRRVHGDVRQPPAVQATARVPFEPSARRRCSYRASLPSASGRRTIRAAVPTASDGRRPSAKMVSDRPSAVTKALGGEIPDGSAPESAILRGAGPVRGGERGGGALRKHGGEGRAEECPEHGGHAQVTPLSATRCGSASNCAGCDAWSSSAPRARSASQALDVVGLRARLELVGLSAAPRRDDAGTSRRAPHGVRADRAGRRTLTPRARGARGLTGGEVPAGP